MMHKSLSGSVLGSDKFRDGTVNTMGTGKKTLCSQGQEGGQTSAKDTGTKVAAVPT